MPVVKTVTALDVRRRFGQLLDEASAGERIVIERAGTPIAALVPLGDLAQVDPRRAAERQLAALHEIRRLVSEAPTAPADWSAAAFVRRDRDRDRPPDRDRSQDQAAAPSTGGNDRDRGGRSR